MVRVFTNGPRDHGSISGRVIPKTLKNWHLIPPCLTLSITRYVSRVKWRYPGKGVEPSPTPRCSSNWKGSLRVPLDYSRQQLISYNQIFIIHIYMYIYRERERERERRFYVSFCLCRRIGKYPPIYIYIYIYCYPPIYFLVLSQPFNMARHKRL